MKRRFDMQVIITAEQHPLRSSDYPEAVFPYEYAYKFPAEQAILFLTEFIKKAGLDDQQPMTLLGQKAKVLSEATDHYMKGNLIDVEYRMILAALQQTMYYTSWTGTHKVFLDDVATLRYIGKKRQEIVKEHLNSEVYDPMPRQKQQQRKVADDGETPGV